MKKTISCILAFSCFFMLLSCSKKSDAKKESKNEETKVMLSNPVKSSSAEEILKTIGVEIGIPEGASEIVYSIISEETAQMDFKWKGADCTARVQPSSDLELKDISGFYYKWQNESTCSVKYNTAQVKWTLTEDNECCGICIWWDAVPGIMYSVSMKSNASKENLEELANSVYIQMQGEN